MKNLRGFALGLALGLAVAVSTVGWAQSSKPADQGQKSESCCAMASCCKGDSCSMKDHQQKDHAKMHGGQKDHAKMHGGQKDHAKMPAAHQGCCCCSDSCNMKMEKKEKAD